MTKHKILVVGVGSIGERHLRCFQTTQRAELSFVEINQDLRQTIEQRYGVRGFASLDEGLANHPTAAVIATPAHLHVEMATRLGEMGIDLLVEKPLSTSTAGLDRLADTVERKQIVLGVAYVLRCNPSLGAMRRELQSGRFGRPVELVLVSGQHFPTYRPAYRNIYYAKREFGGGAIQDALTHQVNAGEWLVGPITRLVADASHQLLPDVEVEDTVHVIARHKQVLASYSLNQHQAPNELTLTVICERGVVRWEAHAGRWRWQTEPGGNWTDESAAPFERDYLFVTQAHEFLNAVESRSQPTCSLEEGRQTLRVNLAILASADGGGWQEL